VRTYVCDWCDRPKREEERWILGYAAERVGSTGRQHEMSVLSAWSDTAAEHPLAVHFCCSAHKIAYITALFAERIGTVGNGNRARQTSRRTRNSSRVGGGAALAPTAVAEKKLSLRNRVQSRTHKRRLRFGTAFTEEDQIRSRGLSVQLSGEVSEGQIAYQADECWSGS
jgi:hypothetical protein